jgi:hypothetical protein
MADCGGLLGVGLCFNSRGRCGCVVAYLCVGRGRCVKADSHIWQLEDREIVRGGNVLI